MILIKGLGVAICLFSLQLQPVNAQHYALELSGSILLAEAEKTDFPIPEDAVNYSEKPTPGVRESVNFQTELSLTEAIKFYRDQLQQQGLTEREINTAITDSTFNLVFESSENGLAVVVQGVDLGNQRNINIRYEKLD
jgi:hypothetical protein